MYKIPAKTLFIGKKIIFMPTCHSTNEEAADIVERNQINEGTIVITNNQSAGKGQRGNDWQSDAGQNLTFSIILKPTFLSIVHQFHLNITISLGILDYLNQVKNGFQVKWPNDIYYHDQKICGILIQNSLKGSLITHAVTGIGLNINQQEFTASKAGSLSMITGRNFELEEVFEQVNEHLEKRYLQLRRGETDALLKDYIMNMYWFGEDHLYKSGEKIFHGRIVGITAQGLLELQTNEGLKHFNLKEIIFVD